jgi:anti-sigma factor RsiW
MRNVSEKIERLIVRGLDGEITPDEQLELDRELLRNPDARAMFDSYKAIDALSARVIEACAGRRTATGPLLMVPHCDTVAHPRRRRRSWMIYAGALAACLALAIVWQTPKAGSPNATHSVVDNTSTARQPVTAAPGREIPKVGMPGSDVGVWQVNDTIAPRVNRMTDRNLILVPGADGAYYLLTIDQVRELKETTRKNGMIFTRDPI